MLGLSKLWWTLSLRWFFTLNKRSSSAKLGLFKSALWVSLISLSIAVMSMALILSIFSGFQSFVSEKTHDRNGGLSIVSSLQHVNYWKQFDQVVMDQDWADKVKSHHYFWTSQALVVGDAGGRGIVIEGISDFDRVNSYKEESQEIPVVIGKALADIVGAKKDSVIKIVLPTLSNTVIPVKVVKLASVGVHDLESRFLQLDHFALMQYLQKNRKDLLKKISGDFLGMKIFFKNEFLKEQDMLSMNVLMDDFKPKIATLFTKSKGRIKHWLSGRQGILSHVESQKKSLSFIFFFLKIVAALNIAATLVVLFLERDKEIALFRAIGMSRRQLLTWVMIKGFLIGLVSSIVGIAFAFVVAYFIQNYNLVSLPFEVYNISTLPILFKVSDLIQVFVLGVLSSLVISFLIALSLVVQQPVNILRHRR